jgi:DNA-binding transcriptional ArsR family regulator
MTFQPVDVFWIHDEETFGLLADPTRLEILELTMVPRSVTEIAEAMGVPRTRLYHHVKLMEEAGMIAIAETRQTGALTEKVYQAAAKSYQPSETFLGNAAPRQRADALISSILNATRADFVRAVDEGIAGLGDRDGKRTVSLARRLMRLEPERLDALVTELEELLNRYSEDSDSEDAITVGVLSVVHPSSRRLP